MRAISLVFGTNNTIAAGTPDADIEELYQRAFKPFLQTLYEFPDIALTLHYCGVLVEWLQERHPEYIMLLGEMVKRKQVELLGGTYYHTILPLIPANDRTAQVELLTTLIRRRFGKRPRGAWVTELVWEPGMASSLNRSGMEYVFLADNHFIEAGLSKDDLLKPVITEDQGKTLLVFPISGEIELFPFTDEPGKIAKKIAGSAAEGIDRVISLMTDGECFGAVNESHRLLFKEGWLADFLEAVCALKGTILSTHPVRYIRKEVEYRRCYFPCISCEESGTPKGGYFRQFLSKYPESNLMYAKLMHTYDLVNQIRGDRYRKKAAREELWRGEDHSAYWQGKRGGIYLHPVRKSVYSALIAAEKTARQQGIFKSHINVMDFDRDGLTEHLFNGADLNMYVHRKGGMVFELDYVANPWNYLDTLSYYRDASSGKDTPGGYPRRAFLDHFFSLDLANRKADITTVTELGDFLVLPYDVTECRRDSLELTLSAAGSVTSPDGVRTVFIEKRYRMKKTSVFVDYTVTNNGPGPLQECFSPEINLSFPDIHALSISVQTTQTTKADKAVTNATFRDKNVKGFTLEDNKNGVIVRGKLRLECDLFILPLEAEWLDRSGHHREYQSTCFFPVWKLNLSPRATCSFSIQLSFAKKNRR